jgi:Condensation domain
MKGVSRAYHIPLGFRLTGELDGNALRRALDRLIARHEALRTSFNQVDGQPIQRITSEDCGFALREHDLDQNHDFMEELQRLAVEEASTAFDLQAGRRFAVGSSDWESGSMCCSLLCTTSFLTIGRWACLPVSLEFCIGAAVSAVRPGRYGDWRSGCQPQPR